MLLKCASNNVIFVSSNQNQNQKPKIMKRFALAADILKAVVIFPLIVIVYMYAGHTTHEKPKKTETHRKTEIKAKESTANKEEVLPKSSRKILVLNKIGSSEGLSQEAYLLNDSIHRIFNEWIHQVHHDTNIYLIIPPVDPIDPKPF